MRLVRDINRPFILTATILIGVLNVFSFFAALGREEGTLGNSIILNLLADIFMVLRFPFHPLLWPLMDLMDGLNKQVSGLLFIIGLFGNCIFYGFILERVYHFTLGLKRRKFNQTENGA